MIEYRIKVKNGTGTLIGEFDVFRNLKINKRLNNYGTCSFEIPVNDSKANTLVALRVYTVWVYREEDGTSLLVWAGEMATRTGKLDGDGNNWITINCYDWLEQLASRYTVAEKEYTNTDAGAIAWDLIDTTQNDGSYGDFGITEGTIEATVNLDRIYHNQKIMDAIIELSNREDGFDFELTHTKVFNVSALIGTDKTATVVLEYGRNIQGGTILEDFTSITNRAIVLGEAIGEDTLQRVEVDSASLQAIYKLRENQVSQMEEAELDSFTGKGEAFNNKYGQPLFNVDITMKKNAGVSIDDFSIGDSIKLKVTNGLYNINEDFRVFEWTVDYLADNTEQLSLVLGNFRL